jgi:hypothetical protein
MFRPRGSSLPRGWPGRIDGDHVVQLAAQTLQAWFTGGGRAREHAAFLLVDVELMAPVLEPPSLRLFELVAAAGVNTPLVPGELIGLGWPGPLARSARRESLRPGDRVELEFERIGVLASSVGQRRS